MVSALEADDLLRRRRNPRDARSVIVKLTPKGRRLIELVTPLYHRRITRASAKLTTEELVRLAEILTRLGEGFEEEFDAS